MYRRDVRLLAAVLPLLVLLLPPVAGAQDAEEVPEPPEIREVVVEGATAWERGQILKFIRFGPGDRLWRTPEQLAEVLERRYHTAGFPAATVEGSFDAGSGTLLLAVKEGVLGEVVIEGVDPSAVPGIRDRLGLTTGKVLRTSDIRSGLSRVEDDSLGAIERGAYPPFDVRPGPDGAVLTVRFVQQRTRLTFVPGQGTSQPWNAVDGFAPWVGVEMTRYDPVGFNHVNAYVRGTWGTSSHDVRWAAGVRRPFGPGGRLLLGYEHHDLTDSDDPFRTVGFEESPALVFPFERASDYYLRRGDEAYAFFRATNAVELGLTFRADRFAPLLEDEPEAEVLARPQALAGDARSVIGTLRAVRGARLFDSAVRHRNAALLRDLYGTRLEPGNDARLDATLEWASASALGGDFTFRRLLVQARGTRQVSPLVQLRLRGLLGLTGGDPPPQRRLALGGIGTLRGYELKSLVGDHAGVVTGEVALTPQRRRWPGLVAFWDGGVAWGEHSAELGWHSDLGVGVEWPAGREFFVRVDGAWALDPLPGSDRFQLTGRVRVPF